MKKGLYLISPPVFELSDFKKRLKSALSAGEVPVFQLRMKSKDANGQLIAAPDLALLEHTARELLPICRDHNTVMIINDYPQIATDVGADGVHIGMDDMDVAAARKIVGDQMIVGASCYDSKDRAFQAGEDGADYVAFGAFYDTQTKTPRGRPSLDLLDFWSKFTILPAVAIGGIKVENCEPIIQAGADFIAVVTGVWDYPKGEAEAVKDFNAVFRKLEMSGES